MPRFTVVCDQHEGAERRMHVLQADDVREVLSRVAERFRGQSIELWRDEEFLGRLKHIIIGEASYWHLQ